MEENDWSFIIKLHSLIEAAATQLLVVTLGKPELEDIISLLELSGQRTGKLAFFKSMNTLDSSSRRFIQSLSEIRNSFVHDVSNVDVTLEEYFFNLVEEKQKGFNTAFKWGYKEIEQVPIEKGENTFDAYEVFKLISLSLMRITLYKKAIFYGSIVVLHQMHSKIERRYAEEHLRKIDESQAALLEQYFKDFSSLDEDT